MKIALMNFLTVEYLSKCQADITAAHDEIQTPSYEAFTEYIKSSEIPYKDSAINRRKEYKGNDGPAKKPQGDFMFRFIRYRRRAKTERAIYRKSRGILLTSRESAKNWQRSRKLEGS